MDKLRAMHFFCRVTEARSFAAAAQSLEVVPSAMSKVVAGLEQELGVARPFGVSVDHLLRNGQLRAILQDWSGDRQPISAFLPPHGRATPKVRLFLDFVAGLLSEPALTGSA